MIVPHLSPASERIFDGLGFQKWIRAVCLDVIVGWKLSSIMKQNLRHRNVVAAEMLGSFQQLHLWKVLSNILANHWTVSIEDNARDASTRTERA
jgi:hypothetical protein